MKKSHASKTTSKLNKPSKENERDGGATTSKQDKSKVCESQNVLRVKNAAAELGTPRAGQPAAVAAAAAASQLCDSYEATPLQPKKLLDQDNIDVSALHDLESDSDSEDETTSKKPIPAWAKDPQLTEHMMELAQMGHSLHHLFRNCRAAVDLNEIFKTNKDYKPRTSSFVWSKTPHKDLNRSK